MKLGVAVVGNVEPYRHYGEALFLHLGLEMTQLSLLEKQFPVPERGVLAPGAPGVEGYIDALHIELAMVEIAESVCHRDSSGPY